MDPITPGAVRKDLYVYLEEQGFVVTDERHKAIKNAIIMHTNATVVQLQTAKGNAMNALAQVKIGPKVSTVINRLAQRRCPACGLELRNAGGGEYVPQCEHFPKEIKIHYTI